jgi:DNA-binding CsgD family transcriptional regulator
VEAGEFIMLVERHHELALLRGMFADCVSGKGRVALISGSLASGKTELLNAFTEHVIEQVHVIGQGTVPLRAAGVRAEQSLWMGVVRQLFHSAPLPAELLDRAFRLIGSEPLVAPETAGAAGSPENERRAVHGIGELLLELAKERPVVIAVDDVQFVDLVSLDVLRYVRCRLRSASLLIALTEWERSGPARPPLHAEVVRQPHCRIALGPLSEAGVAELISRRLGRDSAGGLAPGCYALGRGNPFLTHALIEDQSRRIEQQATPAVGPAFRDAVLDCLQRWDPEFLMIAAGMAILGERCTPELVEELTVQARDTGSQTGIGHVIDDLTAAGLAESGRLRRPEIVDTVLASLAPRDRSRLHSRAAELLHQLDADPAEIAGQLAASGLVPGAWAVPLLRHAAEQALAEDGGLTVKYLELAGRAADDERERVALSAAAARAAWRVNPSSAGRHLGPLHGALQADGLGWRDAVPMIRYLLWQGNLDVAMAQLAAMIESAGRPDARTAAELRLAGEWIYGRLRDRVPEDAHAWLAGDSAAADSGGGARAVHPWRRTATLNTLWATGATSEMVEAAEHILQRNLGDIVPEVGATALLALDHAGQQQRATMWCEALLEDAARQHATTAQAVLGCVRADIAWRRGDLVTARALASTAIDRMHARSWGVLIGFPLSILILANTAMGKYGVAAELMDRAVPEAMFDTEFGLRYLHASGHYHLALGQPLAALDYFDRCGAAVRRWGLDVPAIVPWRTDLAQAYLELGMTNEAKALAAEQLGRPRAVVGQRARAVSLRLVAAGSGLTERVRILRQAVQILERCPDRLELARTLMDLGRAYRELGDEDKVRLALRKAEQVAKACQAQIMPAQGARPTLALASKKRGDRAAPIGVTALSEAEHKVAALAAEGCSNREIGRQLSITVSTVEQHLTSVYRKLNVSGRANLLPELSRQTEIARMAVAG